MIWHSKVIPTLDAMNAMSANTLVAHLDIQIVDVGDDYITGTMPVDARTHQPYGILHGGASVVLAESLGSLGAALCVDLERYRVVGLDINSNHIRGVRSGRVSATATPVHIGRQTQVWSIRQVDENDKLTTITRLTMAVLGNPS
ncbi:MAG: hotdog fold thioesterase [Pseudomonadota bacterium]